MLLPSLISKRITNLGVALAAFALLGTAAARAEESDAVMGCEKRDDMSVDVRRLIDSDFDKTLETGDTVSLDLRLWTASGVADAFDLNGFSGTGLGDFIVFTNSVFSDQETYTATFEYDASGASEGERYATLNVERQDMGDLTGVATFYEGIYTPGKDSLMLFADASDPRNPFLYPENDPNPVLSGPDHPLGPGAVIEHGDRCMMFSVNALKTFGDQDVSGTFSFNENGGRRFLLTNAGVVSIVGLPLDVKFRFIGNTPSFNGDVVLAPSVQDNGDGSYTVPTAGNGGGFGFEDPNYLLIIQRAEILTVGANPPLRLEVQVEEVSPSIDPTTFLPINMGQETAAIQAPAAVQDWLLYEEEAKGNNASEEVPNDKAPLYTFARFQDRQGR